MARNQKIRQKPSTKIGGGDYFDGNVYRSGQATPTDIGGLAGYIATRMKGAPRITKAQYETEKAASDRAMERAKQFEKDYASVAASVQNNRNIPWSQKEKATMAELQKLGYNKNEIDPGGEITVTDSEGNQRTENRGPSLIVGPEPVMEKSKGMAQMAIPEHTIEGDVSMQPQQIQARRSEVLSDRTQGKIGLIGSKMNKSIDMSNQAKRDHIALAQDVNRQIGAPADTKYGYEPGTVNDAYAYAQYKADAMNGKNDIKNVKRYFANADDYAKQVQAGADTRGAAIQGQFDAAGAQAKQASRLSQIVNHLAKRDVANAQTQQTRMNTQGLINSGPSVMNDSVMSGNSIEEVLKA